MEGVGKVDGSFHACCIAVSRAAVKGSALLLANLAAGAFSQWVEGAEVWQTPPSTFGYSNELKPGQRVKGWVTFEVRAATRSMTIIYAPGLIEEPVEVNVTL